jgi:hypothetical protein
MDYSKLTLGQLVSSQNETIRRNALSILKTMQRTGYAIEKAHGGTREVWGEGYNDPATKTLCPHCAKSPCIDFEGNTV